MLWPVGLISWDVGFGVGLARFTLSEAIAFAVHLKDVDVMGQTVEERKRMDMTISPGLRDRRRVSANKTGIAVRKIQREEMRLLFDATNYHHGLAEIRLGVTGGMSQRHKHLAVTPTMFADIILDRRIAALKVVFIPQALKNALGGMSLLAVPAEIFMQPLIDEASESIQLRPLDTRCSPVTGRYGKLHDLLHARARYPKMNCCPLVRSCRPDARDGPSDKVPRLKCPHPPCHQKGPKWQSFTLPAARLSRHFRGKLLHCRSQEVLPIRFCSTTDHARPN